LDAAPAGGTARTQSAVRIAEVAGTSRGTNTSPFQLKPMPLQPSINNQLKGLDALRGIAILMVLGHHLFIYLRANEAVRMIHNDFVHLLLLPFSYGHLGVKLFFVISGFCIHLSYLRWRSRNPENRLITFLPEFLNRRFFRIFPPYFAALLVFWFLQYQPDLDLRSFMHLGVHTTLTHNFFPGFFWNINPSFWSIAIEAQLYLIYPLLLFFCFQRRPFLALVLVAILTSTIKILPMDGMFGYIVKHSPFAYWFEWVAGAFLADHFARGSRSRFFSSHLTVAAAGLDLPASLLLP
jgi:peptidoglycan/LPS O-acetylase OafA/YrhL